MRILFISGLTGYGTGGAQTETTKLVSGIATMGNTVAIAIDKPLGLDGVQHFQFDYPPSGQVVAQARNAIFTFKPDVVHVLGGGIRFLRDMGTLTSGLPWVFTAHNVPPNERTFPAFYGHNRLHYAARNAVAYPSVLTWRDFLSHGSFNAVISHSATVSSCLCASGCTPEKVCEIPFGFKILEGPIGGESTFPVDAFPKLLTVAGLVHHKGLHDVVRTFAQIRAKFSNACYRIIGERRDRNYAKYLDRLILTEGLGDSIRLIPSASEAIKLAALRAADLYIQPSHEEGFCLAYAEAASVVPRLVGTSTGEIPGLSKDDLFMRVVPPTDTIGILEAMTTLLNLQSDPDVLTARNIRLKQRYSWTHYFDRHLEVYKECLS